jgi:hypothetical protein
LAENAIIGSDRLAPGMEVDPDRTEDLTNRGVPDAGPLAGGKARGLPRLPASQTQASATFGNDRLCIALLPSRAKNCYCSDRHGKKPTSWLFVREELL